jgi:hypothetical protein
VKARYDRGLGAAVRLAKQHLRYAVHRTNEHGQRQYREVWDRDGRLEKREAYRRLDRSGADAYLYRLTLSPHPGHQDAGRQLGLQRWTREIMAQLDRGAEPPVEWFAVIHDHPDHRHVHVVAVSPRRLDVDHFRAMRQAGDADALAQQRDRSRALDRQPGGPAATARSRDQGREREAPVPGRRRSVADEGASLARHLSRQTPRPGRLRQP